MFIGRRLDGTIYGAWTCKQPDDADHLGVEELSDNHPEVIAFINRPIPKSRTLIEQILASPEFQLLKDELKKP